jgi:IS30 family transposase
MGFSGVTGEAVREAQDQLNGRPCKTLGWSTPTEAMARTLSG